MKGLIQQNGMKCKICDGCNLIIIPNSDSNFAFHETDKQLELKTYQMKTSPLLFL